MARRTILSATFSLRSPHIPSIDAVWRDADPRQHSVNQMSAKRRRRVKHDLAVESSGFLPILTSESRYK